ncbi:MAG: aromatic ring-hydroxylating dioxygenase subunit alpha [Planctomycetota bacterium]
MNTRIGEAWLDGLWYYAAPSRSLRAGETRGKVFMNRPVLLGRDRTGVPFAIADLCPHRGIRLSAGRFDGEHVRCAYHGWKFGPDGVCAAIPSLIPGQTMDVAKIKVRSYPCRELQGNLWIYLSDVPPPADADLGAPFEIPEVGDLVPRVTTPMTFEAGFEDCLYGLLDPAHTPYVHEGAVWRSSETLQVKEKHYVPSPLGFTMKRHEPASNTFVYKIIGGKPTTEISFALPAVRLEHIRIGAHHICNLTAMTPVDENRTEVTNLIYWTKPILNTIRPIVRRVARKFLGQDQWVVALRDRACVPDPPLMMIHDADVPQKWYQLLKTEWLRRRREGGEFVNPIQPATLRWRT